MNDNKKLLKVINIIVIILSIFAFSLLFSVKYFENDLFFDLKTGENILKYGIDFKDHFSLVTNLSYLYHHWLYDLIIYFVNNYFGLLGIKLFFLFVFFAFGLLYFVECNKIINNKIISLIITSITMYYINIFFTTRVQSITNILFFLEIILLNKIYESTYKKYLLYLLLLCILIVNLHMPLWILSLVLFLPYLYSAIVSYIFNKKGNINKNKNHLFIETPASYKNIFLSLIIIVISGLISPYGSSIYSFFIKYLTTNGYKYFNISELQATVLIYFKYELFIIILLITGLYLKLLKISFKDFFLILGLFVFSLLSIRNGIYFLVIGMYVLIKSYIPMNLSIKKIKKINKVIVGLCAIILLLIINIYTLMSINYPNNKYKINEEYPVEMVKYIKENIDIDNIRLYNHFNFGSYLEYNDIPVFVDSRAEVYIKEFNGGYDIAKDYYNSTLIDQYENIFKKYKFNYALIFNNSNLKEYYKYNDNFKIVKEDDNFILYRIDEKMYNE